MNYSPTDIEWMKRTRRLKLSRYEALVHYFPVFFIGVVPLLTIYNLITMYFGTYDGLRSAEELILSQLPFGVLTIVVYLNQRRRLKFTVVNIKHTDEDLREAARRTALNLQWRIEKERADFVRAFRSWQWTASLGEMITIIREGNMIMVNSISDPNNRPTFTSFGADKKNVRVFLFNLAQTLQGIPENSWFEESEAKKWYAKKYFRYTAYFFSIGLVILGLFLVFNRQILIGVLLIGATAFYIDSDLMLMVTERSQKESK